MVEPDLTIIVGCKNRAFQLKQTLPHWQSCHIKEIIVIDWGSDTPLKPEDFKGSSKVSIVRVDGEQSSLPWNLPRCLNFAASFIKTPKLLKLDCDYHIKDMNRFLSAHVLEQGIFFRGNYKIAREPDEMHLNGALYCWTTDFLSVGGFCEFLTSYGYDDSDLYERMSSQNLQAKNFNFNLISHIPHDDTLRDKSNFNSKDSPHDHVIFSIMLNMFLCKKFIWSKERADTLSSGQFCKVLPETKSPRFTFTPSKELVVSPEVNRECELLAKRCILNDRFDISWSLTQGKSPTFIDDLYARRKHPKFILRALNGLGNKWRTIASAGVIASHLDCIFIIEWIPNEHCLERMQDLYSVDDLLVSSKPLQLSSGSCSTVSKFFVQERCLPVALKELIIFLEQVENVEKELHLDEVIIEKTQALICYLQHILQSIPDKEALTLFSDITGARNKLEYRIRFRKNHALTELDKHILLKLLFNHKFFIESACVLSSSFCTYGDESKWLQRHYKPLHASLVHEPLWPLLSGKPFLGVHIRRGQDPKTFRYEDSQKWNLEQAQRLKQYRAQSHYIYFFREIKRRLLLNPSLPVFVCADRRSTYEALESEFHAYPQVTYRKRQEYNRSKEELTSAIVEVEILRHATHLLGSPWSTFTELVQRLTYGPGSAQTSIAGRDFPTQHRAVLSYHGSLGYNLGDNIQSLAQQQWFSNDFDYYVERDPRSSGESRFEINPDQVSRLKHLLYFDLHDVPDPDVSLVDKEIELLLPNPKSLTTPRSIKVIYNSWMDGRTATWPPSPLLQPLFLSIHVNEEKKLINDPMYKKVTFTKSSFFDSQEKLAYWKAHSPIGCRDEHTLALFQKHKIPAYLSGCLTLSFSLAPRAPSKVPRSEVLIVDAHVLAPKLLKTLVPDPIRSQAHYITHVLDSVTSTAEKMAKARALLDRYGAAKMVITSRLHCALPCLAFGTPVLFFLPGMKADVRFGPMLHDLLGDGQSIPPGWCFENPTVTSKQREIVAQYAALQKRKIMEFLVQP